MIKFVYFDLGGVAALDFNGTDKWTQFSREIGITADQDIEFDIFWKKYGSVIDKGLDIESLVPLIEKKFSLKIPKGYSLLIDGFVNRFEVNKSIWPVIDEIHGKCRIGLLTNMYFHMYEAIKNRGLLPNVTWDLIIDSSIEGVRKPEPKIFEIAESRAGVPGSEILFVENTPKNVGAAKNFGWQVFQYDPVNPEKSSQDLLHLFNDLTRV